LNYFPAKQVSRFNTLLFKVVRKLPMLVLWLIYLDLAMLVEKSLEEGFIVAQNVRFASTSTAQINYQLPKRKQN